jgi:hypothetical protein
MKLTRRKGETFSIFLIGGGKGGSTDTVKKGFGTYIPFEKQRMEKNFSFQISDQKKFFFYFKRFFLLIS